MSWKSRLLVAFARILPIPRHPSTASKRILVISTTALGDTLWATPTLESLKKSFPSSYVAVLTSPIGKEALKNNPWIDRLYLLQEPLLPRFFSFWKALYQERFDTVLILHASQRLVPFLSSLLGASQIIATSGINKKLDPLFTHLLPNHAQHEITRRLEMVKAIGGAIHTETLSYYGNFAPFHSSPKKRIVLHPGSKDPFKRWPTENFATLANRLQERLECEIIISGTQREREVMQQVAQKVPNAHLKFTDGSLETFAELLAQSDLLISNDTGPVHLACAMKRPVIALYSSTDPALCGPHRAEKAIPIYKKRSCEPCLKRKCHRPFCLMQIGVDEVLEKSLLQLK